MSYKLKRYLLSMFLGIVMMILLDAIILERYFFRVKHFKIGHANGTRQIKILQLSDLHLKSEPGLKARNLAKKINSISPDFLILTGDAIDEHGKASYLNLFLKLIDSKIRIIGIPGNHEYKSASSIAALEAVYRNNNAYFLQDETIDFEVDGEKFVFTGANDFIEGHSDFQSAVDGIGFCNHHFLIIHSPLQQKRILEKLYLINKERDAENQINISYIFAGHTHGGQITFFGKPLVLPSESGDYVAGWYNEEKPFMYLSKGFGTSTLPLRFFARAEIAVHHYYYG